MLSRVGESAVHTGVLTDIGESGVPAKAPCFATPAKAPRLLCFATFGESAVLTDMCLLHYHLRSHLHDCYCHSY